MSSTRSLLASLATAASAVLAPTPSLGAEAASAPLPAASVVVDTPLTSFPYTPVLDVSAMDAATSPCEDFYRYSCGGWQKNNPIPPDQASWDVYSKLAQDNKRVLWGILDRYARQPVGRSASQQRIGDAFAACMDANLTEGRAARPMQPLLDRIAAVRSLKDLTATLAVLHLATADDALLFGMTSAQDYADSTRVIAFANPGGLALPDRDYYLRADPKSVSLQQAYVAHMARMFRLLGDDALEADHEAGVVMSIETELAAGTLTRVEQRNPQRLFHPADLRRLQALTPSFGWRAYLAAMGIARNDRFNVSEPAFYRTLEQVLRMRSLGDLQTYLRWHVAHASAPFLSSAFVAENFSFFNKTLSGVPTLPPLWGRCVAMVDNQLGDALGQEFVKVAFSPQLKAKTMRMTAQLEAAMDAEIRDLDWMSAPTKAKALEKLHGVVNKIGYPDRWRDYAGLVIRRDDLLGNIQRGNAFEVRRQLAKIGRPLDRGEWGMTPPTVNAYYDLQMNDINFPAGVLQPPLFDARLDDAPNYGDTGSTIGHELTHGFDDEGRQFDASGTLKNWWTREDADEFEKRTQCLVEQYGQYVVIDDVHVDSRLTLGEDLADLGGMVLALVAWKAEQAVNPPPPLLDGFTPDQRFFIGMAQWACDNTRPEQQRLLAATDPHSPNRYRVNGLVSNFKEFETAFSCKPGQPMAPLSRCKVW
jgi:putative endopeptidase